MTKIFLFISFLLHSYFTYDAFIECHFLGSIAMSFIAGLNFSSLLMILLIEKYL